MKKIIYAISIVTLAIIAIVITQLNNRSSQVVQEPSVENSGETMEPVTNSPGSIAYTIDGIVYTLSNGTYSAPAVPGSASMTTVSIFGEPVYGDLDADGDDDAAVLLAYDGGGSGTYYYAVLALKSGDTYTSTNVLLLGDRIAPQTVEIHDGRAVYNYAVRNENEPMTTPPSLGKSLWIYLDAPTNTIGEWVKDFEGEVDTARMNLEMKKWEWVESLEQGEYVLPKKPGVFTLSFADGKVSIGTDCNNMGGTYTVKGNTLKFGPLMSTLMFCEDSQETAFGTMLGDVESFAFTTKGTLELQYGERGVATFR